MKEYQQCVHEQTLIGYQDQVYNIGYQDQVYNIGYQDQVYNIGYQDQVYNINDIPYQSCS